MEEVKTDFVHVISTVILRHKLNIWKKYMVSVDFVKNGRCSDDDHENFHKILQMDMSQNIKLGRNNN